MAAHNNTRNLTKYSSQQIINTTAKDQHNKDIVALISDCNLLPRKMLISATGAVKAKVIARMLRAARIWSVTDTRSCSSPHPNPLPC
jgi:hypothetical protein